MGATGLARGGGGVACPGDDAALPGEGTGVGDGASTGEPNGRGAGDGVEGAASSGDEVACAPDSSTMVCRGSPVRGVAGVSSLSLSS